jgi:hypothetical protein
MGGFKFFIYNLDIRSQNDYYFFVSTFVLGDSSIEAFIILCFIFPNVIYTILSLFVILLLCYGVETTI